MELLFKCKAIEQKEYYEQYFRYSYSSYIEYSCCFRRIVSMLDTALFNRPIAISKVAVGLLSLRGYSLHRRSVNARIHVPNTSSLTKVQSNCDISSYNIFSKNYMYNTNIYKYNILSNLNEIELNNTIYFSAKSYIVNRIDNYALRHIKYLYYKNRDIFLYNYNINLNRYDNKALRGEYELNVYPNIILGNYNNSLNLYYTNTLTYNKIVGIYNNCILDTDIKSMNVNNIRLLNINTNKLNIYKDYMLGNITIANILFNPIITKQTNSLMIYQNILTNPNNNIVNMYDNILLRTDDNVFNIYNNVLANYSDNILNIYINGLIKDKDSILNVYDNGLLREYRNVFNIYNNIYLRGKDNILTVYDNMLLKDNFNEFIIYDNVYLKKIDSILNVYSNTLLKEYRNEFIIYDNVYSKKLNIILNVYNNMALRGKSNEFIIYNNILSKNINSEFSIYDNINTSKLYYSLNAFKEYSTTTSINIANIYDYRYYKALSKDIGIADINDCTLLNKTYTTTFINKDVTLKSDYKLGILNIPLSALKALSKAYLSNIINSKISKVDGYIKNIVTALSNNKSLYDIPFSALFKDSNQIDNTNIVNNKDISAIKHMIDLYIGKQYNTILDIKYTYLNNDIISSNNDMPVIILHKDNSIYKKINKCYLDNIEFIYKGEQLANLTSNALITREDKKTIITPAFNAYKGSFKIMLGNSYTALKDYMDTNKYNDTLHTFKYSNESKISNSIATYKGKKELLTLKENNALRVESTSFLLPIQQSYKYGHSFVILDDILSKKCKHFFRDNNIATMYNLASIKDKILSSSNVVNNKDMLIKKKNKYLSELDIRINTLSSTIYKSKMSIEFINQIDSALKTSNSFIIKDTCNIIEKINKSFVIYVDTLTNKIRKPFVIQYQELVDRLKYNLKFYENQYNIYKKKYNLEFHKPYKFNNVLKVSKVFNILYQDYCSRNGRDMNIYKAIEKIIKRNIPVDIKNAESVFKNNVNADYSRIIYQDSNGLIVPIAKTRHYGYISRINSICIKSNKKVQVDYLLAGSVITRSFMNTAMPDLDIMMDKSSFKSYIDYTNEWAIKKYVKGTIQGNDVLNKYYSQAYTTSSLYGSKEQKEIYKEDILSIIRHSNKSLVLNKDILATNIVKDIYLLKNDNAYKANTDMTILNQYFARKTDNIVYYYYNVLGSNVVKNMEILDAIPSALRDTYNLFYDYDLFPKRLLSSIDLIITLEYVHKIQKDLELIIKDNSRNFVWVYETPDPFPYCKYGIDELLLPEQDTRYSDFENIIFNKETLTPRNPVKQIDETTFIARYPIKHPLPERKDIGIVYIDVETSVMRKIFSMYYRIWQSKIFQFGSMTMIQSTKMMLEYIYTWIIGYFPLEQMEEALRVFRLIRWYSETAIIQNSQYIISYEYDVLESKLNTGKCNIPNNLSLNDTMIIDSVLGVIKNNPIYIGKKDATVTFYIDNKKNTRFIFSLSNTVGSVNIYVNNKLVDVISKSVLNKGYDLPYTGIVNEIRIEKTYKNNLNSIFYIGNIKIPDCSYKNLTIEYNPVLREGNKPINEVASKMIEYANLYDNKEEVYDIIRKGNLGVSETNKRLEEYWKIHHENKIKGKRLTIKEV